MSVPEISCGMGILPVRRGTGETRYSYPKDAAIVIGPNAILSSSCDFHA